MTNLFQRGNTQRHPCNHWTYSPYSCSLALMSSHYLNVIEWSSGRWGPLIWICFWHVTDSVSKLQIRESSLLSPRLMVNWLLQRVELCEQYVLTMYAVMYYGVRRAGRLTLMLIRCVYSFWLLIEAGVASWCWRLLLCVSAPCLAVETVFPVTWAWA